LVLDGFKLLGLHLLHLAAVHGIVTLPAADSRQLLLGHNLGRRARLLSQGVRPVAMGADLQQAIKENNCTRDRGNPTAALALESP